MIHVSSASHVTAWSMAYEPNGWRHLYQPGRERAKRHVAPLLLKLGSV